MTSTGVNASENVVYDLFCKVFLPIHVFANTAKKDGNELCDILIKILDRAIVVSVKDREFDLENTRSLEWSRWSRKTITKKASSLTIAARYIRSNFNEIYLDNVKSKKLPPWVIEGDITKIHKIIIGFNVDSAVAGNKFGNEKTLRLQTIKDHTDTDLYTVGIVKSENEEVHVFDIEALKLLLQYADTPFECLDYLDWRAERLTERNIIANGEEDLLTEWMARRGGYWKPLIDIDEVTRKTGELPIVAYFGIYEQFRNSCLYERKMAANQESGFWNALAAYISDGALINFKDSATWLAAAAGLLSSEPKSLRAFAWHVLKEKGESNDILEKPIDVIVLSAIDDTYAYFLFVQPEQMSREHRIKNASYMTGAVARQLNRRCLGIGLLPHSALTNPVLAYADPEDDCPIINRDMSEIVITQVDAHKWLIDRFPAPVTPSH